MVPGTTLQGCQITNSSRQLLRVILGKACKSAVRLLPVLTLSGLQGPRSVHQRPAKLRHSRRAKLSLLSQVNAHVTLPVSALSRRISARSSGVHFLSLSLGLPRLQHLQPLRAKARERRQDSQKHLQPQRRQVWDNLQTMPAWPPAQLRMQHCKLQHRQVQTQTQKMAARSGRLELPAQVPPASQHPQQTFCQTLNRPSPERHARPLSKAALLPCQLACTPLQACLRHTRCWPGLHLLLQLCIHEASDSASDPECCRQPLSSQPSLSSPSQYQQLESASLAARPCLPAVTLQLGSQVCC